MTTAQLTPAPTHERLLSRQEAADFLGLKKSTLDCWAMTGRYGLPCVKVGSRSMYRMADLLAFIERRTSAV